MGGSGTNERKQVYDYWPQYIHWALPHNDISATHSLQCKQTEPIHSYRWAQVVVATLTMTEQQPLTPQLVDNKG